MKTTNYTDTFIEVADDCPVEIAETPPVKGESKTVANLQFEMINNNPYKFSSDDIIFQVYAIKNDITKSEFEKEREKFFSRGQACLRSSPLAKRYGWGVHCNSEGKVAIYAVDSDKYKKFSSDKNLKHLKAMRSKRV